MDRFRLLTIASFTMLLSAGSAFALSVEPAPTNPDGSPHFADPDNLADGMSDQLTGNGGGERSGFLNMFGDRGVTGGWSFGRPANDPPAGSIRIQGSDDSTSPR